ncbi:MAG: DNA-directed RNA polymerase subunit alpha [Firmicutes bacterium]|nr:DNA-directed RNA polymerase subunit alpha [Erysipelotrichaceae bacterium]MDD6526045.1 DNA-directed RNA polymerase subunit alpha [Bacillota bacterium]MDD7226915.1 DNA-directed RNA polymerase subunit alpha [Bacillota bacterium]MDY4971968.1 DNA-directed RNA polymerase subunit alpha [Erysipelotrichaceae bacterium]MDY5996974.1 DNA-directed RNA polymerase subunit alpha [Erysipelotrichaceae bacterium]
MQKFERAHFEVKEYVESDNYGKFVLEPLERGFGITLGNALRRVLISSLPGAAVFSIKADGVYHEFTTIPGVREDVAMMILNIKDLVMKIDDDEIYTLKISAKGPCTVTAGDIICPESVEILNKDLVIAHVEKGGVLEMELKAKNGRGYVSSDANKQIFQGSSTSIGTVFTDSIYTPIEKVAYDVEPTRVGQDAKYDRLVMEIYTDGSITPQMAISLASKILIDHLDIITNVREEVNGMESIMKENNNEVTHREQSMMIEDLDLSVRSYNCLKRAGIQTVDELTQKTEEEMMRVRNLGKKSMKEVKEKITELGLSFKAFD